MDILCKYENISKVQFLFYLSIYKVHVLWKEKKNEPTQGAITSLFWNKMFF